MCHPASQPHLLFQAVYVIKSLSWLFWGWFAFILLNLVCGRFFFNASLRFINWLIKMQHLHGTISGDDASYKYFRRDLFILAVLLLWVLILLNFV